MNTTPDLDISFVENFNVIQQGSESMSALFRPLFSDGVCVDVEVLAANPSWAATRSVAFQPGMLGSQIHSDFDSVLLQIRETLSEGRSASVFQAEDTNFTVASPPVHVTYRLLENGYIVVVARYFYLTEEVAELAGPTLIVDLPEGPNSIPQNFLAVNESFRAIFLAGYEKDIPTLADFSTKSRHSLEIVREHAAKAYPNSDWAAFTERTNMAYTGSGSRADIPFLIDGQGYFRSYFMRETANGWVGIWIYRLADSLEVEQHPEFAETRLEVIRSAVAGLDRPTAAHRPVFDSDGNLIDISLLWANKRFDSYRARTSIVGDLGSENRVRFDEDLLPHLRDAWEHGSAAQIFQFRSSDAGLNLYNPAYAAHEDEFGARLEIETIFVRTSDGFILEWGEDVNAKIASGSELAAQRRALQEQASVAHAALAARESAERFGRELHDNILQELFVVGLTLAPFDKDGAPSLPREAVAATRTAMERVTRDIRALITDSKVKRTASLTERLETLTNKWRTVADQVITFADNSSADIEAIDRIPHEVVENTVYIAKEALANAVKHSHGDSITIEVAASNTVVELSVTDDGIGFASDTTRLSGTRNMSQRAEAIGADLNISSGTTGTTVSLLAPYQIESV